MTREEALSAGILAINTWLEPTATSDELAEWLDENGEEAVRVLVEMRDEIRRTE